MSLAERFQKAVDDINSLKSKPSDEDLLEIYGLYKQSTVGDVNTEKPGMLDFKAKAKWNIWEAKKGMSQDDAKEKYIAKAQQLVEKHGK